MRYSALDYASKVNAIMSENTCWVNVTTSRLWQKVSKFIKMNESHPEVHPVNQRKRCAKRKRFVRSLTNPFRHARVSQRITTRGHYGVHPCTPPYGPTHTLFKFSPGKLVGGLRCYDTIAELCLIAGFVISLEKRKRFVLQLNYLAYRRIDYVL